MKKYFILAVAALAASVACSKVETEFNPTDPGNKIAFEVANYAAQTKANVALTNAEDGIYKFHTVANQFPAIGKPVQFMDVDILPWNGTTQVTKDNIASNNITSWAPAEDYFWPKTGYINFYSYAGTIDPQVDFSGDKKTATFTYANKTIGPNDNILVADAALHFNTNKEVYKKDHVSGGVPTLFHHQLAKIIFKVHLKTTKSASSNTIWTVRTIEEETINGTSCKSAVTYVNKGSLTLKNEDGLGADAEKNTTQQAWTANPAGSVSGWVASETATDVDEIKMASKTLTIELNKQESAETEPAYLIAERSVMPQVTTGTKFVLYYEVSAKHTGATEPFMKEIRTVGVDVAKTLKDLVSTIDDWPKNTKITYNVIIDPVSEKVTFDPAVEEWAAEEGKINVPLS